MKKINKKTILKRWVYTFNKIDKRKEPTLWENSRKKIIELIEDIFTDFKISYNNQDFLLFQGEWSETIDLIFDIIKD